MIEYKEYRKKSTQMMRPYIPGERLVGISVSKGDIAEIYDLIDGTLSSNQAGMIAFNKDNPSDRWYVSFKFFTDNYEEV